jgi:hypothetical protein
MGTPPGSGAPRLIGRVRRPGPPALAAIVAVVAVAGCAPATAPSATSTEAAIPTPTVTQYQLNTTVWYAGLMLTVTSATAIFDPGGGTVTVLGQFQNPGSDDETLEAPIRITAGAQTFEPVHGTQLPDVAAGGTADLMLTFDVAGLPSVDGAELRVGPPEANQAVVAFGPGGAPTRTLEPVKLAVKGTANASDLRISLTAGELRWDLPDWTDELPTGTAALTLTYDAAYRGSFAGGLAFTADNVSLKLPDGAVVRPRRDGRSQSLALLLPGKPQAGLRSRFEVPSSEHGTFILMIANGAAHATIAVTVPG